MNAAVILPARGDNVKADKTPCMPQLLWSFTLPGLMQPILTAAHMNAQYCGRL
jgi:hypothetical protein